MQEFLYGPFEVNVNVRKLEVLWAEIWGEDGCSTGKKA